MTLRGSTSDFPLESVIGLLAGTSKTGELQVRGDGKVGALGFAGGRLVAAVMEGEGGENALGAVFAISQAEFEFTPWESAPEANLEGGDLVSLLKRAAEARDRIFDIRASIPDDRMRFRLSEGPPSRRPNPPRLASRSRPRNRPRSRGRRRRPSRRRTRRRRTRQVASSHGTHRNRTWRNNRR